MSQDMTTRSVSVKINTPDKVASQPIVPETEPQREKIPPVVKQLPDPWHALSPTDILALQRSVGNQAVQRHLAMHASRTAIPMIQLLQRMKMITLPDGRTGDADLMAVERVGEVFGMHHSSVTNGSSQMTTPGLQALSARCDILSMNVESLVNHFAGLGGTTVGQPVVVPSPRNHITFD